MTRGKTLYAALALGCLAAGPVFAECVLPPAPTKIPDGNTATEAEMVAAMQTLKRYDGDVNTYLKCLEFEAKQNRITKDDQSRKHNQAVDLLQSIANKFNEQVRIFKAKNG
ncbi:MAG TPA: hypothetical protein VIL32_08410 [Steroidobacteraceae bacterium]